VYTDTPTRRRLPDFCDRTTAIGFSLRRHTSSLRGCTTTLDRVSSSVLFFSIIHRLIFMAVLKSRSTNCMRLLPLVERTIAKIPRVRDLYATTASSSPRRTNAFSRISPLFFFVTCFSSFDVRREEDFCFFFCRQPAVMAFLDPRLASP